MTIRALLSWQGVLQLGREHNISPKFINRWKKQYLVGELNQFEHDQETNKLKKEIVKLEQMIGGNSPKENYILKKKKE